MIKMDEATTIPFMVWGILPIEELVKLAGSWINAPAMIMQNNKKGSEVKYDRSQKAYLVRSPSEHIDKFKASINCSDDSPLFNPAIVIEGWGEKAPELTINGKKLINGTDFMFGYDKNLDSTSLIVWLELKSSIPVDIEIH